MTAFVALAVYRVQSEKLFVDTFRLRLDALNECINAAHARLKESQNYRLLMAEEKLPELYRLWEAERAAKPLFGSDVHAALAAVDSSLRDYDVAYSAMVDAHYEDKSVQRATYEAQIRALNESYRVINLLAETAQPYVQLGTRGLSLRQRTVISHGRLRRKLRGKSRP